MIKTEIQDEKIPFLPFTQMMFLNLGGKVNVSVPQFF